MRRALLGVGLLALAWAPAGAGQPEIELGFENLLYRTARTRLNRDNLLGLDPSEDLLRGGLGVKQTWGSARLVAKGYLERRIGSQDRTEATLRQAYLQYSFGDGLTLRAGKQRIAWGSGFAWNPTNRLEPAKNPLNTGLEQAGSWAVRMDVVPASWVGLILVAARDQAAAADLPLETQGRVRRIGAARARFLVWNTDLALVLSGGAGGRSLVGLDLGRSLGGSVSVHLEGATYRGAELVPARADRRFFRLAAGLLYLRGESQSLSLEYFWNSEGYDGQAMAAYRRNLDDTYAAAQDPRLPPPARQAALDAYRVAAALPFSGGLGLRRHYLHGSWTRSSRDSRWTGAARAVVGLADGGLAFTPGLGFAPRGDLTLQLDALVLLGPQDSEFRLAPIRSGLQTRIRLLF
ncbi:MAG TPA: hypothetical protein VJU18_15835 [Vicinamibacteria bacterium]|nr:hypothetical protein [Vicinamibacteria bacterium]